MNKTTNKINSTDKFDNLNNSNDYFELFFHNGSFYKIKQQDYETRESYLNRIKFIFDGIDKRVEITEITKLSLMWLNVKLYDCEYDESIMKKIKEIDNNL